MKNYFLLTFLIAIGLSESPLSERYHTYAEIESQLFEWNETYGSDANPNYSDGGVMYKLMEIGKSHEDELPFWAVKLTYNADEDHDKPKILVLGQCHAEEILGVEISMALIEILLNPTPQNGTDNFMYPNGFRPSWGDLNTSHISEILEKSEVWVVPTHNPEGLSVVHGWEENDTWYQDVTYRKNKHDLDGNNIFNFIVGQGNDSDGVDLNRNYDFNWIYGDGIYEPDGGGCNGSYFTDFDYYRGPEPFSESEIQAIRDLALEQNFVVSLAYHSSRSGCLSEKVKYSWEWAGSKYPPDKDVLEDLGVNIATLVETVDAAGAGHYEPSFSGSFKGVAHNWFYARTGCFQYLIEVGEGGEGMQPSEPSDINSIVHNNLLGAFYALNRTAGISSGNLGADSYGVTGLVTDATTGSPIQNTHVKIVEMDGGVLSPRLTDDYGRFRRLLVNGTYTIQVDAIGYESYELQFTPSDNDFTLLDIQLTPLDTGDLKFNITDVGSTSSEILSIIYHENGLIDTLSLAIGEQSFDYPMGNYDIKIFTENRLPIFNSIIHDTELTEFDIELMGEEIVYDSQLLDWTVESGDWQILSDEISSQSDLKYSENTNQIISMNDDISLSTDHNNFIKLEVKYELEWDEDSLLISVTHEDELIVNHVITHQNWDGEYLYLHIPNGTDSIDKISLHLVTDESVNYRGLELNGLWIVTESEELSVDSGIPSNFMLKQNYPNPFNPHTNIQFQLGKSQRLSLHVYNVQGEFVKSIVQDELLSPGNHDYTFSGAGLSSGIYFYKLVSDEISITEKMLLLK